MKISALPKHDFDKLMRTLGATDENIETEERFKNLYLISISHSTVDDPDDEMEFKEEWIPHFKTSHKNVLRLKFDDVVADGTHTNLRLKFFKEPKSGAVFYSKAFNKEQAQQVLEFVRNIPNNEETEVVVHCAMGKSRSVAIAEFVAKINGLNPDSVHVRYVKSPNKLVTKMLEEALDETK